MNAKVLAGAGAAALALTLGAGVASAAPDVEAIANMTCTYPQLEAALNAQAPQVAGALTASPVAAWWIQNLVASPPDQRRQLMAQVAGLPEVEEYSAAINMVSRSCQNY